MLNKNEIESILKNFAAGNMCPEAFKDILYREMDSFEHYFNDYPRMSGYLSNGLLYYLLEMDYSEVSGQMNAVGAISLFLNKNNMKIKKTHLYEKKYQQIMTLLPKYLGMPISFFEALYADYPQWHDIENNKTWLKERLKEDFRYLKRPPRWIQNANWPVTEHGPLIFVGQLDVTELHHDASALYVFFDPATGEYETFVQSY